MEETWKRRMKKRGLWTKWKQWKKREFFEKNFLTTEWIFDKLKLPPQGKGEPWKKKWKKFEKGLDKSLGKGYNEQRCVWQRRTLKIEQQRQKMYKGQSTISGKRLL